MATEPQITTWKETHRPATVQLQVQEMYPELPLRFPLYTLSFTSQVRYADAQTLRELAQWCEWKAAQIERRTPQTGGAR